MNKIKVLFLCIHNSARSQMAEAFLNAFAGDRFESVSAGLEKGTLNPFAVEAMKEEGIDIYSNHTKEVDQFVQEGRHFDYVITVCDQQAAESCPVFPGVRSKISWNFPDPSKFDGSYEEKMEQVKGVRDQIKNAVLAFIKTHAL